MARGLAPNGTEKAVTGTAQTGTELSLSGYRSPGIMSWPTNRWNGSMMLSAPSMTTRRISTIQSERCTLATLVPWVLRYTCCAPPQRAVAGGGGIELLLGEKKNSQWKRGDLITNQAQADPSR